MAPGWSTLPATDRRLSAVYPVTGRFLAQSRPLPGTPWTLTVLSQLEQVDEIAQSRAMVAVVGAAFLFMLGLMLR